MAVNTPSLDDGKYNTMSSLSIVASRATVTAQDITATSTLSTLNLVVTGSTTFSSSALSLDDVEVQNGVNTDPTLSFINDPRLGWYRSAASTMAQSAGTLSLAANTDFIVGDGGAAHPYIAPTSDPRMGLYRSAASVTKLSCGTLDLTAANGLALPDGGATAPAFNFTSDPRIGLYRSTTSTIALNAGTFSVPTLVATSEVSSPIHTVTNYATLPSGTTLTAPIRFTPEPYLGIYRSSASNIALSYGTLSAEKLVGTSEVSTPIATVTNYATLASGTSAAPTLRFTEEAGLGLYRVGAGVMGLGTSAFTFMANFRSAQTLAASLTTTNVTGQGDIAFSVLSLTANGAQFGFRSGNTTYIFYSGTSNQQV